MCTSLVMWTCGTDVNDCLGGFIPSMRTLRWAGIPARAPRERLLASTCGPGGCLDSGGEMAAGCWVTSRLRGLLSAGVARLAQALHPAGEGPEGTCECATTSLNRASRVP